MIRKNPAHDLENPPGQLRGSHLEKPLAQEIDDWKLQQEYHRGFRAGFQAAKDRFNREHNSEEGR